MMNPETFKAIISRAIDGEIEACNYYHEVSERVQDPALKRIFFELAADETGHKEFLHGILGREPGDLHVDETQDYKIAETLDVPLLSLDMRPPDGITLAIRKELDAMQMYTQLARVSSDSEEKRIFLELAKMEQSHKTRLEDVYTSMAFPEVW